MATRILFLSAQLQPFLAAGVRSLMAVHDVEIIIYCEKKESNNLIEIQTGECLRIFTYDYEPDTFFWNTIETFKPDIVVTAGWMFRMYLGWSKALKKNGARTICAMDTQWKATIKQKLLVLAAPFTLQKSFTHAWVPGKRQEEYAVRLGFSAAKIIHNLYATDTSLFAKSYLDAAAIKDKIFSKTFLFVGRLEAHKIKNLLHAFHVLSDAERGSWRLQLIGNGSLENDILLHHSAINVAPSLPQNQLINVAGENGVFCLCSSDEPWGMVAQEFAAAGLPLLISKQCGSSDHFLNSNGFLCDGKDVESIKNGLLYFIESSDNELFEMSKNSHQIGIPSNSTIWAQSLINLV